MAAVGGLAQIPLYATIGRGDRFAEALAQIAPLALRYGATQYEVRRSREDPYRFTVTARFADPRDFYAWWEGPEWVDFRIRYQTWFQKPVVYDWLDQVAFGEMGGNGNGEVHHERPEPLPPGVHGEVT
jgi:hypothetical protein